MPVETATPPPQRAAAPTPDRRRGGARRRRPRAGARAGRRVGAIAARAVRGRARLRRHLPRGARARRLGDLPRRADARAEPAERIALGERRARSRAIRPSARTSAATASAPRVNGRQPLFNRSNDATIAQARADARVVAGRPRQRRAGPDPARQPGLLRRPRRPGHAGNDARQQGGDRRAARLGQAQLRGRHGDHHRHPRGAGALRPGDGAGDRRRQRPRHQADRARPAGRPQQRRAAPAGRAGGAAGDGGDPGRRAGQPRRPRSIRGSQRPRRLRRRPARDREGARAAPADGRCRGLGAGAGAARSPATSPATTRSRQRSACSSTCRCTPAARSRTASRKRSSSRTGRATTSRRRAAASTQTHAPGLLGAAVGRAQVKALEAAESSSKLALEATQLGYSVGVRVNIDVLNAQTSSTRPSAIWRGRATTCCSSTACACARLGAAGAVATSWGSMRCWRNRCSARPTRSLYATFRGRRVRATTLFAQRRRYCAPCRR